MINAFEPSKTVTIEVEETGFVFSDCIINGEKRNLYEYIEEQKIDIRFPLVCDYSGATINTSFQRIEEGTKEVVFYAPLFKDKKYLLAKPLDNYVEVFRKKVAQANINKEAMIYNCNCILNYLYGDLENNDIGFSGPTTFGEIAYQLINQTFTYLLIDSK